MPSQRLRVNVADPAPFYKQERLYSTLRASADRAPNARSANVSKNKSPKYF
jgi:hypothetical protein